MEENEQKSVTWRSLVVLEAITLGLGGVIAFVIRNDIPFYQTIEKPSFAPPSWLFPIAWTILYALMALSAWLCLRAQRPRQGAFFTLYGGQLAVNLVWPLLFFMLRALGLSFLWLVFLLVLIVLLTEGAFRRNTLAGWLLVPYVLWVAFAGALNFSIAQMNP